MKTLFLALLITLSTACFAQNKFKTFKTSEGLEFSYRFKKEKCFKKDSPLQLVLRIQNNKSEAVKLKFSLNYYWQLQNVAESEMVELCIKSGKTKRGGRAGLVFPAADLSNVQLRSSDFKFDINNLEFETVTVCK